MTFSKYISGFGLDVTDEQETALEEIALAGAVINPQVSFDELVLALSRMQNETRQTAKMMAEMCATMDAWDKALPWYTRLWLRVSIRLDHYAMLFWDWFYGWGA